MSSLDHGIDVVLGPGLYVKPTLHWDQQHYVCCEKHLHVRN